LGFLFIAVEIIPCRGTSLLYPWCFVWRRLFWFRISWQKANIAYEGC